MKKWYLKWWVWFLVIVAALIIPFVINESYKAGEGYKTSWGASDVLAFYGSFLSFVGTVLLGVVALYQSYKANCLSERLLKLEEEKNIPIVDIIEIIDEPKDLPDNTYRNSLHITFNDIDFHFKSDNTLDFCDEPVFAFALKNICPNHITSIHLKNIEQCVVFENEKKIDNPIQSFSWNGGIRVLDCNESQYLLISGVSFDYPKELTEDDILKLGYRNPMVELILTFEIKNIKGAKFSEKIKVCFPFCFFATDKLNFPCIFEKEIINIATDNK